MARQSFAIVPQRNNLDRSLTIRQNLTFHAGYHGLSRSERNRLADESLEWVGLGDHAKARADQVSGGQAQRVMIARALMHRPRVLFLDEPATGLDPQSQIFVRDRVAELKTRGVTVVITTHDMEEASKLCDRIGIVDHGKLLALDTPEALTSRMSNTALTVTVRPPHSGMNGVVHMVQGLGVAERVEVLQAEDDMAAAMQGGAPAFNDGTFRMKVYSNAPSSVLLPTVIKALTDTECEIKDLNVSKASLEDVFVDLTGKEMR
ncbi:ABC transporter ATP-binding protein [Streptomyces indonesiensis]